MTSIDAVKAYREYADNPARRLEHPHVTHFVDCGCFRKLADAAIAALLARVEELSNQREQSHAAFHIQKKRAEKAEQQYDTAKLGWLGEIQRRERAEAEVERHRRTALTCLRARRSERTLKRKAVAALAKCEQQKRGLATAAQTGMVAANRVIELEAELERLKVCGSCEHWWSGLMGCGGQELPKDAS